MRVAAIVAATGLVTACHEPYSNEDLRFLFEGVPPRIDVAVPIDGGRTGVDTPGGPTPSGTAQFYLDARNAADAINRDVLSVLTWVDDIVATPPSARMDDRRVWGPLPLDNGGFITLVTDRVRTSTVFRATSTSTPTASNEIFEFAMQLGSRETNDEGALLLFGQQVSGDNGVQGRLFLDLAVAEALDPTSNARGQVAVGYDSRFGQRTIELILGELYAGATAAAWRHTDLADGAGTFQFYLQENVDLRTPQLETWIVAARWRADGQGRADVLVAEGDLNLPLFASECWDADFNRTYLLSNIPDPSYLPQGDLEGCAADLRTADFPP